MRVMNCIVTLILGVVIACSIYGTQGLVPCRFNFGTFSAPVEEDHEDQIDEDAPYCRVKGLRQDWLLGNQGFAPCIINQVCNYARGQMPVRPLFECYRECNVTTSTWKLCQRNVFGVMLNTERKIRKHVCPALTAQQTIDYGTCLLNNLGADFWPEVIQVNHCQARVVGIIIDSQN